MKKLICAIMAFFVMLASPTFVQAQSIYTTCSYTTTGVKICTTTRYNTIYQPVYQPVQQVVYQPVYQQPVVYANPTPVTNYSSPGWEFAKGVGTVALVLGGAYLLGRGLSHHHHHHRWHRW